MPKYTLMWMIPGCRRVVVSALLVIFAGCSQPDEPAAPTAGPPARPAANVALRVAVVNDPELVAAISKLRGEWQGAGGGELTIEVVSLAQALEEIEADLLIFPSRYLGELCEANRLRPMRQSTLDGKELDFGDILPLVREREIVYGQQIMALPLGCPVPLVAAVGVGTSAAITPLADQFSAFALLARVAPLAQHPSREAIWFDAETMKPRLTEPPFLRALTELVATKSKVESPCEVAQRLLAGEVETAIVWPCRTATADISAEIQVQAFPAATQIYNPTSEQWESTLPRQVTLLATSGRLVGVTSKSRNAASAFRLASWLASPEIAGQLLRECNGMAICRASQRRTTDNWLGETNSAGSRQFSEQIYFALSQREGVTVPRLPGVDRYLDALADAVRLAADGKATPAEALTQVSKAWEALTDELGRDKQLRAYQKCLGISQ